MPVRIAKPVAECIAELSVYYSDPNGNYRDGFPPQVLDIIRREKLFKCFLPESLGGRGISLIETLEVIHSASYINGSLGWLIQIGNGGNYFAAYFDEQTSRELFSPENAVLAGSGALTGVAIAVEGGYRISGEWKFCSGADHASFFTCSARVQGSNQTISCALMPVDVDLIRDWNAIGLKYTSTHSILIEDAFVPHNRVFSLEQKKSFHDVPAFYFPFLAYAQVFFLGNVHGIYHRFLDEAHHIKEKNRERWRTNYPERERKISDLLENALRKFNQSGIDLTEFVYGIETTGSPMRDGLVRSLDDFTRNETNAMRASAQEIFPLLGMDALYTTSAIGVMYTDLLCATQHALLNRY